MNDVTLRTLYRSCCLHHPHAARLPGCRRSTEHGQTRVGRIRNSGATDRERTGRPDGAADGHNQRRGPEGAHGAGRDLGERQHGGGDGELGGAGDGGGSRSGDDHGDERGKERGGGDRGRAARSDSRHQRRVGLDRTHRRRGEPRGLRRHRIVHLQAAGRHVRRPVGAGRNLRRSERRLPQLRDGLSTRRRGLRRKRRIPSGQRECHLPLHGRLCVQLDGFAERHRDMRHPCRHLACGPRQRPRVGDGDTGLRARARGGPPAVSSRVAHTLG